MPSNWDSYSLKNSIFIYYIIKHTFPISPKSLFLDIYPREKETQVHPMIYTPLFIAAISQ